MATINELFFSVQGEGRFVGTPMQFVRFYGCNLDCSWCDQPSALSTRPGSSRFFEQDNDAIADLITRHPLGVPVCFTGGEPFQQEQHLEQIIEMVRANDASSANGRISKTLDHRNLGRLITIETNGTQYSYKLAGQVYLSMSPKFDENATRLLDLAEETVTTPLTAHGQHAIVKWIDSSVPMHLKFVVTSLSQFESILGWVCQMIPNPLRRANIPLYFQPEWYHFREGFKQVIRKWVECERWRTIQDMGFEEVRFIPQTHKELHVR